MRKPLIPEVRATDPYRLLFDKAVKENIDQLTGVRGALLEPLATTATTAEIIAKVNEIVERLNR